ncbi:hypothetical protein GCM10018980_52130 [Streptomyces capoamus]|uniref:Uncharacterized protein n=1 Tax=Streptomyces capoamus TaxID=68183 RepID=A0A919EZR1_9ACTN|nr:hypothetical protein [Streptomyces capoamus]GGW15708.1 hypothetical protein GCM10010501_28700 [Streptomyces libani subsp. rufus]GHG62288.1 hypothetical protein GCM10018980_52130 [Streptomyces capoamus]
MATIVFNVAAGRLAAYADLPAAADSLIMVPLAAAGLPNDATMRDYATLAAVKAGATEQTTLGRKTLTNVTVTVDNAADRVAIDCDDVTWTATAGAAIGAVVICYKPDTASADSAIIPLTKHDVTMTPDGTNFTLTVSDFFRASSAS